MINKNVISFENTIESKRYRVCQRLDYVCFSIRLLLIGSRVIPDGHERKWTCLYTEEEPRLVNSLLVCVFFLFGICFNVQQDVAKFVT